MHLDKAVAEAVKYISVDVKSLPGELMRVGQAVDKLLPLAKAMGSNVKVAETLRMLQQNTPSSYIFDYGVVLGYLTSKFEAVEDPKTTSNDSAK